MYGTEISAAAVLDLSTRQTRRPLTAYRDGGGGALINKARGRASNNRLIAGVRECAMELVRSRYADFVPTLATEALLEKDGVKVSRETLRKWMVEDGLWLSRKQRKTFHQPRLRRECLGELVQIDGSEHRWFEKRGEPCTLLVFIDDATSKLMQLRFVPSESTDSYVFLPQFLERFNERFAVPAQKSENLHRKLDVQASRLADILFHREQRHVSKQLSVSYDRNRLSLIGPMFPKV
jgi:hypothetical protein